MPLCDALMDVHYQHPSRLPHYPSDLNPWLENSAFFWKISCYAGGSNEDTSPQKDHYDHLCLRIVAAGTGALSGMSGCRDVT